jgi:hypothetical protein
VQPEGGRLIGGRRDLVADKRDEIAEPDRERIANVVEDELAKALARRGLTWDQGKEPWLRTPPVDQEEFRRELQARVNLALLGAKGGRRPRGSRWPKGAASD